MLRRINIWIISAFLLAVVYILNKVAPFPVFELIQWFLAGALMAYILRRRKITLTPALLCAGLGLGVGFARIPAIHGATEDLVWLLGIGGLVAALFRIEGLGRPETRVRPLMWLGARSYSLYAVHFPLGLLTWAVVGRLDLGSSVSTLCVVTVGLAVSLLASSLSYKFVERPSLEMARGRPAWGPAGAPKGASGKIQKNG